MSWGDGKLTFKGKTYPFSIDGLSLVDWGISKAQATGDVYNLTDAAKFAGTYVAAEAGLTLAGGMGGMVLRNSGWRGLAPAFCFSGRPAATRHQRIDHQDEVKKITRGARDECRVILPRSRALYPRPLSGF